MSEPNASTATLAAVPLPHGPGCRRVHVLGVAVDPITRAQAVETIMGWCRTGQRRMVVTPNLDHAVLLHSSAPLRAAYAAAGLVLADGMPLVWASRLTRRPLPERVAGADLVRPICRAAAAEKRSIFLFGSSFDRLARAGRRLRDEFPGLEIRGLYAPPRGDDFDLAEEDRIVALLEAAKPDILFIALGMPRQELWAARNLAHLPVHAVLCTGAGLDFVAEPSLRAPHALQIVGLEWLWRAFREPRRLARRYLRDAIWLPRLLVSQLCRSFRTLG